MAAMILTSLPEWCFLQGIAIATGGVKGRLAKLRRKCSSPSFKLDSMKYTGNNDLAFLETELRSLLMSENPYAKPIQSTFDQLSHELESLCATLESVVNPALLTDKDVIPDNEDSLDPSNGYTAKYSKLWELWACLEDSWTCGERFELDLVNGPNPKLFLVQKNQASQLLVTVTHCNELLLQLSAQKSSFSIPKSASVSGTDIGLPEQVILVLKTLFEKFSRCSSNHELLLCPSQEGNGHLSQSTVDLFLSCSANPNRRHETRFLPLDTRYCVKEVHDLCSDIQMSKEGSLLQLILKHHGLFNITNVPSPKSETLVYSLEDLLPKGIFSRIDIANYGRKDIFNSKQKTALALRLAKCFLAFFDADQVLPTWDTQRIFLATQNRSRLQHGQLYVCFVPPVDDQVECSNQPGDPIFLSFAKLLLEIEEGQKIDLSHCKDVFSQVGDLCARNFRLEVAGRNHYAEAVKNCLLYPLSLNNSKDNRTAVRRRISELVIQHLEAELKPTDSPHSKRRRSDSLRDSSPHAETPSQKRRTGGSNDNGHANPATIEPYRSTLPIKARVEPVPPNGSSDRPIEPVSVQPRRSSDHENRYVHRSELLAGTKDAFRNATVKWVDTFKCLRNEALSEGSQKTIRIAVLDTGYKPDRTHNPKVSQKVRGRWKDFVGVSTPSKTAMAEDTTMEVDDPVTKLISPATKPLDEDGTLHGTRIVNLLHDLLPNFEIYVGRVTKDVAGLAEASKDIAAAITHAADPEGWNADIITMSFGSSSRSKDIEDAISNAQTLRNCYILFFAAAGNDGGNYPELYPAALQSVIPVRGTYGTSGFIDQYDPNPRPDSEGRPLFGTLAYRVPCGPNDEEMSGCSIATPILAAIAAVFIEFATLYAKTQGWNEEQQRILLILKTRAGMQQLFKEIAGTANAANDRYYVAPEQLFSTGSWGQMGWFHLIQGVCYKICMPE